MLQILIRPFAWVASVHVRVLTQILFPLAYVKLSAINRSVKNIFNLNQLLAPWGQVRQMIASQLKISLVLRRCKRTGGFVKFVASGYFE